ncbi:MAG: molybdopterin-dependent oxidoreductase, partial [Stellaceae bacterium]
MLIKAKRGWELPERQATPESLFLDRRRVVQAMGVGAIAAATGGFAAGARAAAEPADPSAGLYPMKRNDKYKLDRPITPEKLPTHYNNFYEFTEDKDVDADALPIRPWTITFDGMVAKPFTIGIDDLLKKMPLEERLYRHRCVEAWSMAVPWSGFPMSALVDLARPLGSAQYVLMETFLNAVVAPGQKQFWYPWPYVE